MAVTTQQVSMPPVQGQRMPKRSTKEKARPAQTAFDRYAGEPVTVTGRYDVPIKVIEVIRKLTPAYGSQGRALQVATEILIRQPRPIKCEIVTGDSTRLTYKLLPRTIELLTALLEQYEDAPRLFSAVSHVLKQGL